MSRRLTQQLTDLQARVKELEDENVKLKSYVAEHEVIATDAMSRVQEDAQKLVEGMHEDLRNAMALVAQVQPHPMAVIQEIIAERARQDAKHGSNLDSDDTDCFFFTMEEVGEVMKALQIIRHPNQDERWFLPDTDRSILSETQRLELRKECIHAAACYIKWVQIMDARVRGEDGPEGEYDPQADPTIANYMKVYNELELSREGGE